MCFLFGFGMVFNGDSFSDDQKSKYVGGSK